MTGLSGPSWSSLDPRRHLMMGQTFKNWVGTLSGVGFAFRLTRDN